jgi:TorA maturation chaperone TorD
MRDQSLEKARTEGEAWHLLGHLVLLGPMGAVREILDVSPAFKNVWDASLSDDGWAVEHQRVFGHEVFPYGSVFLSEDAKMGGQWTAWAERLMEAIGLQFDEIVLEADHLGKLALALGAVGLEKVKLQEAGRAMELSQFHFFERSLLEHLLGWLGPLVVGVQQTDSPFFSMVLELMVELACEQAQLSADVEEPAAEAVDSLAELLAQSQTRLRDVARFLTIPSACGAFLCKAEIARLAAQVELATGFGHRTQMLESLFFAAIDHGKLDDFVSAVAGRLTEHSKALANLQERWGLPTQAWRRRITQTQEGLLVVRQ